VTAERSICNAYAIRIDRKTISYRLQITQNRLICVYIYIHTYIYIYIYIYIYTYYNTSCLLSVRRNGSFFSREKEATTRIALQRSKIVSKHALFHERMKIWKFVILMRDMFRHFLKINAKNSLIMEILDLGLTLLVIIQDIFKCAS